MAESPFALTQQVADDKHDTVAAALAARDGDYTDWPSKQEPGLFPVSELPAQQQPSPFRLSK